MEKDMTPETLLLIQISASQKAYGTVIIEMLGIILSKLEGRNPAQISFFNDELQTRVASMELQMVTDAMATFKRLFGEESPIYSRLTAEEWISVMSKKQPPQDMP